MDITKNLQTYFEFVANAIENGNIDSEEKLNKTVRTPEFPLRDFVTLLEALEYSPDLIEREKKTQVYSQTGKIDFLLTAAKGAWALELKAPDVDLSKQRPRIQLRQYLESEGAVIGVLFNGREAIVLAGPGRRKAPSGAALEVESLASVRETRGLVELFQMFASATFDARAVLGSLRRAKRKKDAKHRQRSQRIKVIQEEIRKIKRDLPADLAKTIAARAEFSQKGAKIYARELRELWRETSVDAPDP